MRNGFWRLLLMTLALGCMLPAPGPACAETVSFPLQMDYPFLKTLVVQSAFTDPGRRMIITDPDNDCQQIALSNPSFAGEKNLLRIELAVHLKGGTFMGDRCLFPVEWNGFLVAHMRPRVVPGAGWQLSFDPVNSVLLDRNRRPDRLMGHMWNLFEAPVMARMGRIGIPIDDPIRELKPFLLSAVPEQDQARVNAMLASLRPGKIIPGTEAMRIQILADVETLPPALEKPVPEKALTPGELEAFIDIWETWDAFLVHALMSLTDMPLTDVERETLLSVLLETRYRFTAELGGAVPSASGDFVREQFVDAWEKLAPIFKSHLARQPSANSWGVLAFFTASDALAALDKHGPLFNIEISRNGFIRLARMLSANNSLTLQYSQLLDPELRTLLGLTPPPETLSPELNDDAFVPVTMETAPATEVSPQSMNAWQKGISRFLRILGPRECRAEKSWSHPGLNEIRQWLVTRDNIDTHLKKIKPLLESATRDNLKKQNIPDNYRQIFQKAVYATAWQESCYRQFIVDKDKLTYIRSYNNSSVGMMQINERVWRGMYNIERLRWDIAYNAAAGVDILNLYLRKYAMPKMKSLKGKDVLDSDGLACSLYAMYNAGPAGFSGYVQRRSSGKFSKIDNHFREKFSLVKNGQWDRAKDCF